MKVRRILIGLVATSAALVGGLLMAGSASAATPIATGSWHEFYFGATGSGALNEPFTFFAATSAAVQVTDGFQKGDQFAVYDNGVLLGSTSAVAAANGSCGDPDVCFTDPTYSHGSFVVGAGNHSITIVATVSPYNGGGAWLRVVPTPLATCDTTITGTHGALTLTSGLTCISNATITGGITVTQGASVVIDHSTVKGSITAYKSGYVGVCKSTIGSISARAATGPIVIGDPAEGCAGNQIGGGVNVSGNTDGAVVVGNTISGAVVFTGNTGTPVTLGPNP